MHSIIQALWMGLLSLLQIIFHPIFWLVIYLVSRQYKKQIQAEKKILGIERENIFNKIFNATLYGLLGGLLGSVIMIFIGISISQQGLIYIWPIAILLFMVKSRYLCFSYAGGFLALFSLIFGFPSLDVPGLMALVAVLHFIESFLIFVNGDHDSLPIIVDQGSGKYIGGYSLQRFWPIPIIIMTIMSQGQVDASSFIQMPDWWPLIKPSGLMSLEGMSFFMISIVAALGYGDVAFTKTPKEKVKTSALKLGLYSVILLVLSIISSRIVIFQWIAALFAPIAHEFLILHGRKEEREGIPIFTLPNTGVRILEVMEGSASKKMGISRGDVLYSINNIPINSEEDLSAILAQYPTFVWIQGENYKGEQYTKELKAFPYGLRTLGVLILPNHSNISYVMQEQKGLLERWWERYKNKVIK